MRTLLTRSGSTPARLAAAVIMGLAWPSLALAHAGELLRPHDLWSAWRWDAGIVVPLLLSATLYAQGTRALWGRDAAERGLWRREAAAFAAGWIVLALALVSPLHPLGEALFSAHMVQHELLMVVAAPLLVLGRPLVPALWAVPPAWRRVAGRWGRARPVRAAWRTLTRQSTAWTVHAVALGAWHVPVLYEATLRSEAAHAAQHVSFLATALLFWWSLLGRRVRPGAGCRRASGRGTAVIYLFAAALYTGVLGALLTFSQRLWYTSHAVTTAPWGLTPLQDQQLAGLIMWVPGGVGYLVAALALLAALLRPAEARAVHRNGMFLKPPGMTAPAGKH